MATPESGPIRTMLERMSPTWLSREWGQKVVLGLMGYFADALLEAASLALKAPWLREDTSPNDAVALQSSETKIRRYPTDTNATHRERSASPWAAWQWAGTKDGFGGEGEGLEGQLHLLGYPNAYTKAAYEWAIDTDAANWSRFVVVIPEGDHSWTEPDTWGTGTWGDGRVWGLGGATVEELRSLRLLIRQWKAAHEVCAAIHVIIDGHYWGEPGLEWGTGTWGGTAVTVSAV